MKRMNKFLNVLLIVLIILISLLLIYWFGLRCLFAKNNLKTTLSAMTNADYTEDFYYVNSKGIIQNYIDTNELGYAILTKSKFEIEDFSLSWKNADAIASVSVKYPNVYKLFNDYYSNKDMVYSTEEISRFMTEVLHNENDVEYFEKTIQVNLVQYKSKWYLIENEAIMDVYSGGLYSEYKNVLIEKLSE